MASKKRKKQLRISAPTPFSLRIEPAIKKDMKKIAIGNRHSLNDEINVAMEHYIKAHKEQMAAV